MDPRMSNTPPFVLHLGHGRLLQVQHRQEAQRAFSANPIPSMVSSIDEPGDEDAVATSVFAAVTIYTAHVFFSPLFLVAPLHALAIQEDQSSMILISFHLSTNVRAFQFN